MICRQTDTFIKWQNDQLINWEADKMTYKVNLPLYKMTSWQNDK
jgi:hypothetical protein